MQKESDRLCEISRVSSFEKVMNSFGKIDPILYKIIPDFIRKDSFNERQEIRFSFSKGKADFITDLYFLFPSSFDTLKEIELKFNNSTIIKCSRNLIYLWNMLYNEKQFLDLLQHQCLSLAPFIPNIFRSASQYSEKLLNIYVKEYKEKECEKDFPMLSVKEWMVKNLDIKNLQKTLYSFNCFGCFEESCNISGYEMTFDIHSSGFVSQIIFTATSSDSTIPLQNWFDDVCLLFGEQRRKNYSYRTSYVIDKIQNQIHIPNEHIHTMTFANPTQDKNIFSQYCDFSKIKNAKLHITGMHNLPEDCKLNVIVIGLNNICYGGGMGGTKFENF